MIRIVLTDDHEVVLSGLRSILGAAGDMEVVSTARNVDDALAAIEHHRPDVAVADLSMPEKSGLELVRRVTGSWPRTRVVVLSMQEAEAYVSQALSLGASGYVVKSAPSDELLAAIRDAAQGRRYLSSSISRDALEQYESRLSGRTPLSLLTDRERDVLLLVVSGLTSEEIAHKLEIGRRTVDTHRANLLRKTGARSTADMVRFAIEHHLT